MMWILLWVLLPVVTHADMNDCQKIANQDQKQYCLASYSGSATFCDRIVSYDLRTQCMRLVVNRQRQATYQTAKPPQKEEKK
jgi:hypothetical protein